MLSDGDAQEGKREESGDADVERERERERERCQESFLVRFPSQLAACLWVSVGVVSRELLFFLLIFLLPLFISATTLLVAKSFTNEVCSF